AGAGMMVDPGPGNAGATSYSGNVTFGAQVNIVGETSWFKVISGRYISDGSLKNSGGSFILMPDTFASFIGKVDNVNGGPSVKQNDPLGPRSGFHWQLLLADAGFANATTPSYDTNAWVLDPVGNPQVRWDLRAK